MSIGERTDSLLLSAALSASTRNLLGPHILDVYGKDEPCTLELQAKLTALSQQITKRSVNENYS